MGNQVPLNLLRILYWPVVLDDMTRRNTIADSPIGLAVGSTSFSPNNWILQSLLETTCLG